MLTLYGYAKCSTCRKARAWLDQAGRDHRFVDITTDPPDRATLGRILEVEEDITLPQLFNRSGQEYRRLGMKDRLPTMEVDEALELLAGNGRLVKRPIVTDGRRFTVGFSEAAFEERWGD